MSFEDWMKNVDRILIGKIGLSSRDLVDRDWWCAWDDELDPAEAIETLIADPDDVETFMMNELFGA